ncbi:MAG: endolytic transglycosylase MltG [Gemmatimonadaceae bacterium]
MTKRRLEIFALASLAACAPTPRGAPIRVIVPRGSSFAVATDSLKHAGLIGSPFLFRMYARFRKEDRNIKPGTYLLKRGTPWADIVEALNGGKGLVSTMTIPEGFGLFQIVPLLSETLQVPVDSVTAAARDPALRNRVGASAETLEGYVFPDTYAFPVGTTARQAITEMVRGFERQWKPAWNARLDSIGLDRNKAMTLASIIEREARRPEERPVIAAVYLNRLKAGMLLQADPTVQFALGRHTPRVLLKDLETDSPYNTYKYSGLPPGPIASPGSASIAAALNPANVDYLYFVAAPDGHHEFRRTLTEHDQAKKSVRSIR